MKRFRTNLRTVSVLLTLNVFLASCSNSIDDALGNSPENSKTEKNLNGVSSKMAQEYSGEELFEGIFFAYGDFAKNIESHKEIVEKVNAAPADQKDLFNKRFSNFVKSVKTKDADYFENFKKEILSGDNSNIQNAIKNGSIHIYENVAIILPEFQPIMDKLEQDEELQNMVAEGGEISPEDLKNLNVKYQKFLAQNYDVEAIPCSWAVACFYYAALAIHNTVAVTANLAVAGAVAIYLGVTWWGPKLTSPRKGKSISVMNEDYLKFELFVQEIADASQN
ncbi:hypothetical protein WH221_07225 [Chryseobacterium culicis]|uniref:Antimicrobial peptide, SdpC family n=2 Tax=Chryseobacterium TaxID=59732 RepID=A0A2S9CZU9_CHRCI|nr:hypothetical protein [Chryseobacterium culicis]PRB86029.1 hypothetical protein CQ022_07200 [Chryseobacterium culicis]PRB91782.1 hypothetical protein CQ033_00870 [Chryseobacterium culicis]